MFLNVGYDLTEKQVRLFFDEFGPVTDVYLPRQANGRNKGFGFATFSDAEALQAALKVSAHVIEGFTVQVRHIWSASAVTAILQLMLYTLR